MRAAKFRYSQESSDFFSEIEKMDTIMKRENCLEDSKLAKGCAVVSGTKSSDGRLPATSTTKMKNKTRPFYESARRARANDVRLIRQSLMKICCNVKSIENCNYIV